MAEIPIWELMDPSYLRTRINADKPVRKVQSGKFRAEIDSQTLNLGIIYYIRVVT